MDGLAFPEGPRWREGRLWFSDQVAGEVLSVDLDGRREVVCRLASQPSGLGWTAAGELLVVSMLARRLLRLEQGLVLVKVADLEGLAGGPCNDMAVDAAGRAYVGNFGFDMYGGEPPRATRLVLVEPDGAARSVGEDLRFPNGTVITPDGRTLIVAETFGRRLTAFDVEPDGSLSGRRTWAEGDFTPDGACLDAEGCVWIAAVGAHAVLRLAEGGEVRDRVDVGEGRDAYACMLGGPERRTLFVCTASTHGPETARLRDGRIEMVDVAAPGAGLP